MTHRPGHMGIDGRASASLSGAGGPGGIGLPPGGGPDPRGPVGGPGQVVPGQPPFGTTEGDIPYVPPPQVPVPGQGIDGVAGGQGGFWEWLQNNQGVAGAVLGTGVEAYGAYQTGKAQDREFEQDVIEYEKDQEREDERLRRREESYQRILDRRKAR